MVPGQESSAKRNVVRDDRSIRMEVLTVLLFDQICGADLFHFRAVLLLCFVDFVVKVKKCHGIDEQSVQ